MKRLLFLLTVLYSSQTISQPYSISFSGVGLSTVKVQNLTTGTVVDVPSGDVLLLSTSTGILDFTKKSSLIKIYPNPMTDNSILEILPPVSGDAVISVYDMTGKVLVQFNSYLENSSQEFNLSGIRNGLHVINIQGNGYQFSEKLLSNGISNSLAIITRMTNNIQSIGEKKSTLDSKGVQGNVNMAYNTGDRLKYTAVSGNNSTVMTDIPVANKTVNFTFTECNDGDNNYYPVVQINTQLWMAENLKATKYNDGVTIPLVTDNSAWSILTTPGYCFYNKDAANKENYGALYNWHTVYTGKLCPTGWHVPTDDEWTTMENYLIANGFNFDGTTTGNKMAKTLASTSGWTSSSYPGFVGNTDYPSKRNSTGFTALPGGNRSANGPFNGIGDYTNWWSATESSAISARNRSLSYNSSGVSGGENWKQWGFYVRCVKD